MEWRQLTAADRDAFERFECANRRYAWSRLIEEMIRERLAGVLELGDKSAVGLFDGAGKLVGIAVWDSSDLAAWRCSIIAVAIGHQRRGYGMQLKQRVIDMARAADASWVYSAVHIDNDPMIELNRKFGAKITHDPDSPEHMLCVIPLFDPST